MIRRVLSRTLVAVAAAAVALPALPAPTLAQTADPSAWQALSWRHLGPYRGGRSVAVAGVEGQPLVYYMGAVGGGVWKTTDGGTTWEVVSDDTFGTSSVGAIAVAPSDPNVVYVGMGEHAIRGVMTSHGDGVYRSDDAGRSWRHLGLPQSRHISRIRVHPRDPDVVYAAVQGAAHGETEERGVYRSTDGGESWEQVLFVSASAGASDLAMDVTNPRILYAAFWDHIRLPWQVVSGGEGSGLWKSTDGGDSWEPMNNGLPVAMGKTAVDVSAADPDRLYAMIEADPGGGLYVSDNGGRSWRLGTDDWTLRARPWYYTEVFADPTDENTVYVLSAPMMRSVDGGQTFQRVRTPHGDNHDLWVSPADGDVMINANDGGANVSFNGGETWSTQANQPTVQFYRAAVDNRFPYHVYGGQQDNSTVAIASAAPGGIGFGDWYSVGGCESAQPAFDQDDPRFVYAGCYMGILSEYDHRTDAARNAQPYPVVPIALSSAEMKYRYNWSAPMVVSQHDPQTIYHGANVLLRSRDGGKSWEQASPDLTRADPEKLGYGGGPITNEGAGGEIYGTLAYVAESPLQEGLIWTGSDDGLVYLTRDGGDTWEDVTPSGLPEGLVNAVDPSPHNPGGACIAFTRYKFNDFTPWAFCTDNFGEDWDEVSDGFADEHFVRVVREDPVRPGLLYAGTEQGVYISFNDGTDWQPLGLNLPRSPITDLQIQRHRNDLVAATGGMGFWVLDDLSVLQQLDPESDAPAALYTNRTAYRVAGGGWFGGGNGSGRNPPAEGITDFHLAEMPEGEVRLEFIAGAGLPNAGEVVRVATTHPDPDAELEEVDMEVHPGMNRSPWDLRYHDIVEIPELYVWGSHNGRRVPPGDYTVRLTVQMEEDGELVVLETTREVRADPRVETTTAEYLAQDAVLREIATEVTAMHRGVMDLGGVRGQVSALVERIRAMDELDDGESLAGMGSALADSLTMVEDSLVQWETYDGQTVLNAPSRLNLAYIYLHGAVDEADDGVGEASQEVLRDLNARWHPLRDQLEVLLTESLDRFNRAVEEAGIPPVDAPRRRRPIT